MSSSADIILDPIHRDFSDTSNEYNGNFDKNKLKSGAGNLNLNHKRYQRYQGQFFQDCLHGRGHYNYSENDDSLLFEGNFYANKFEGYGKFYYNNCNVYEGLYKDNVRFGPGVFTYKDGSQDVGLWIGKNLIRLCRVINGNWIPRIAQTSIAKVKLLKHKKLVPIYNETTDRTLDILKMLEVHEEILNQSEKLYNIHIRNTNSHFFNTKLYDTRYFCEKDCYIDVALTPSEIKTYYEERDEKDNVLQDEINLEEGSQNKSCCEEVPSDVVCVCENPKQVRINGIKLELKRVDNCLKDAELKVRIARCRRRYAKKREREMRKTKKLSWKTVEIQSPSGENEIKDIGTKSTNTVLVSFCDIENECDEEEYEVQEVLEEYEDESTDEDDDIVSDDGIDYETACRLVISARRSLEILFLKKLKLTDKLNAEYNELEEEEIGEEIAEEEEENKCETSHLTKQVLITDLLAWNNEELSIDIMKHTFLHRNFEKGVPFCVADILCGDRSGFNKIGTYEESCGNFLTECSNGNCQETLDIFYKYDLNPDLCDSRGNTGVIYAAARDKIKIIKILVNLGANVDSLNDDCFTPLGICMLRYLATQHQVTDWEKAFLKDPNLEINEETDVRLEWRPHVSLASINTVQQFKENPSLENLENASRTRESKRLSHIAKLEILSDLFGSNLELIHSNYFIESIMDINHRLSIINLPYQDAPERFVHKIDDKQILQNYLLLTDCIKPPPEKKQKEKKEKKGKKGKKEKKEKKDKKDKKGKSDKSSKGSKKGKKDKDSPKKAKSTSIPSVKVIELSPEEIIRNNRLNSIFATIMELLTSGANPNICEVPQPILILSLFTKNLMLVESLLLYRANPNVTTHDENLSALHILVSVPPSFEFFEILKLVLNYSGNPNFKASSCHWLKEKQELIGKYQLLEEDLGKTPLHLLCMRYDFKFDSEKYLNAMALSLINNGFNTRELYLGHTPLSIAMLRGNVELIKTLLDSQLINPNQCLGENMGIPLTLFILKRYSDKLPDFQICCEIIETLINHRANPFKQISNVGNIVEFMIKEHEPPPSTKKKGKKDKKGKPKKEKKKKDKKGKKGKKGKGKPTQEQVKEILISFTRSVLERHLKGYIVKYLFDFVRKENYYDEISETLAKFINVEETIKISQLLFNKGRIKKRESNYDNLHDLIEMIINSNSNKANEKSFPSSQVNIRELIENFHFARIPNIKGNLILSEPETIQHNENYNVCYQCLRKQGCQLFSCPKCNLIYFCSLDCNKKDLKVKSSFHKCATLFYKQQEEAYLAKKRLEQSEFDQKPIIEEMRFGPTEKEIIEDKSKLLHLGRQAKKCQSLTGLIFLSESDADLRQVLYEKFGIGRSRSKEPSKKYDKHGKFSKKGGEYGGSHKKGKLLAMQGDHGYGKKFGDADQLKGSKDKSSKRAKSSDSEGDGGKRKKTKHGAAGKGHKNKSEHDDDMDTNKIDGHGKDRYGKDGHGKYGHGKDGHEKDGHGKDGHGKDGHGKDGYGKDGKGKKGTRGKGRADDDDDDDDNNKKGKFAKGDGSNASKKGKSDKIKGEGDHVGFAIKKEIKNGKYSTKENLGGKSEKGYGRSKSAASNRERTMQQTGQFKNTEEGIGDVSKKLDQLKLIGIENYESMSGGKELELKRRLPQQYQYFLEKISEYWPDFDISMLFLPYACYRDGQLYYRFVTKEPIFMETYSTT